MSREAKNILPSASFGNILYILMSQLLPSHGPNGSIMMYSLPSTSKSQGCPWTVRRSCCLTDPTAAKAASAVLSPVVPQLIPCCCTGHDAMKTLLHMAGPSSSEEKNQENLEAMAVIILKHVLFLRCVFLIQLKIVYSFRTKRKAIIFSWMYITTASQEN